MSSFGGQINKLIVSTVTPTLTNGDIVTPSIETTSGGQRFYLAGVGVGTLANPIRNDPTGTTDQPVRLKDGSGNTLSATGTSLNVNITGGGSTGGTAVTGIGRTTLPTTVASGAAVNFLLDRFGRTYTLSPVLSNTSSAGTPITTNTNTTIITAPSSGNHLRIHRLWAQNSSATGTWCYFGNGSGVKTIPFYLGQYQPFGMDLKGGWELSTATGLFMNTATTGANIEWFVEYETLAD